MAEEINTYPKTVIKALIKMMDGELLNQLWENDEPPFGVCYIWYNRNESIKRVCGKEICRELYEGGMIELDHTDNAQNRFYKITSKGIDFITTQTLNKENK